MYLCIEVYPKYYCTMCELTKLVKEDLDEFFESLKKRPQPFFNENHFQVELAFFLRGKGKYDQVMLEYTLPKEMFNAIKHHSDPENKMTGYPWPNESNVRIDIVLQKDSDYYAIELKYKLASDKVEMDRFGDGSVVELKHQGAQNYGFYHFWKDVKRLELLKQRFPKVVGGIAVFLTNDSAYYENKASETAIYFPLAFSSKASNYKSWAIEGNPQHKINLDRYPNMYLQGSYKPVWHSIGTMGCKKKEFKYCLVAVDCLPA